MSGENDFFSLLEQDLLVSVQDTKSTQEEALAEVIAIESFIYNIFIF